MSEIKIINSTIHPTDTFSSKKKKDQCRWNK